MTRGHTTTSSEDTPQGIVTRRWGQTTNQLQRPSGTHHDIDHGGTATVLPSGTGTIRQPARYRARAGRQRGQGWNGETDEKRHENAKSTFTTIPAAMITEFSVFRRKALWTSVRFLLTQTPFVRRLFAIRGRGSCGGTPISLLSVNSRRILQSTLSETIGNRVAQSPQRPRNSLDRLPQNQNLPQFRRNLFSPVSQHLYPKQWNQRGISRKL